MGLFILLALGVGVLFLETKKASTPATTPGATPPGGQTPSVPSTPATPSTPAIPSVPSVPVIPTPAGFLGAFGAGHMFNVDSGVLGFSALLAVAPQASPSMAMIAKGVFAANATVTDLGPTAVWYATQHVGGHQIAYLPDPSGQYAQVQLDPPVIVPPYVLA